MPRHAENMAIGYTVAQGEAKPALDWDMSWAGGAGSIYSTVGDLFRWNEALARRASGERRIPGGHDHAAAARQGWRKPSTTASTWSYRMSSGYRRSGTMGVCAAGSRNGLAWLPKQKVTLVALAKAMPPEPGLEPAAVTRQLARHLLADGIAQLPVTAGRQIGRPRKPMGILWATTITKPPFSP